MAKYGNPKKQITGVLTILALLSFCCGCPTTGSELQTCSNLTFKENIVVTDEDAIYEDLFECYENQDAGVKTFGGIAYDVGFTDDGAVDCVQLYKEEIAPRSDLEAVQQCQLAVLEQVSADTCEDCGLRGYGFLLCFNEFNSNDCDAFISETRQ